MQNLSSLRALSLVGALAGAFTTAACSSSADLVAGNKLHNVSLSFTAKSSSGFASLTDGTTAASSTVGVVGISRIQLVLTKLELDRSDNAACVDENDDDDVAEHSASSTPSGTPDCEQVTHEPLLLDLPVDGSLKTQLNVPLSSGSYRKMEAKLGPVSTKTTAGAAFLKAHPEFANLSIKIDGTFKGAPFTYKSGLRAGIEMKFSPPLVIDATTKNATVSIDASKWFFGKSGEVIDPTKALPGTSGGRAVESNIRASFHAFEDNGQKGKDEGQGHNGNR